LADEGLKVAFKNIFLIHLVEIHLNGKGLKNIDLHVTECCIVMLAIALVRLQHRKKDNLSSVAYLT
jgi:hypothetical protein